MYINTYILDFSEESIVKNILERLREHFPAARFDQRDKILGIGEEGRYLLCYFALRDEGLSVKFKNREWRRLSDGEGIIEDLYATVELFGSNDFKLRERTEASHRRTAVKTAQPADEGEGDHHENERESEDKSSEKLDTPDYLTYDYLLFEHLKQAIPESVNSAPLDVFSRRTRNALSAVGVTSIGGIISLNARQLMAIPNLGKKCFYEICDRLASLGEAKEASAEAEAKGKAVGALDELFNKKLYVINNKKRLTINFDDVETKLRLKLASGCDDYRTLYLDIVSHVSESAESKLTPKEHDILLARIGIKDECRTLDQLGERHGISSERARQLIVRAIRKIGHGCTDNETLLSIEHKRIKLSEKLEEAGVGVFIAFLLFEGVNPYFIKFLATHYTYNDVEPKEIRARIGNIVDTIRSDQVRDNVSRLFNERITSLITFAKKREITDADFARLKPESIMQKLQSSDNSITHNGKIYEAGSLPERRVLLRFLTNNTFKEVKTHSLRVPYKDSYILPDFQCLTHLNHLVIVDVKPLLNMCKYENIEKFTALREYCQKYGFGYLIIDDRGNSFEAIDEENAVFTREILAEIKKHGNVSYEVYREIYDRSGASIKSLLTLIKRHNLKFSLPFTIHE